MKVNETGIQFKNAPAFRKNGTVAREDVAGLFISVKSFRFFRKVRQLAVIRKSTVRLQRLLLHENLESLKQLRSEMAVGLGIEIKKGQTIEPRNPLLRKADDAHEAYHFQRST